MAKQSDSPFGRSPFARSVWRRRRRRRNEHAAHREIEVPLVYVDLLGLLRRGRRYRINGVSFLEAVQKVGGFPRLQANWKALLEIGAKSGGWYRLGEELDMGHAVAPLQAGVREALGLVGYTDALLPLWPSGHFVSLEVHVQMRVHTARTLESRELSGPEVVGPAIVRCLRGLLWEHPHQVRAASVSVDPAYSWHHLDTVYLRAWERGAREAPGWEWEAGDPPERAARLDPRERGLGDEHEDPDGGGDARAEEGPEDQP